MTSGCVSDLLTKPKPWVMLSYRGRESYNKMLEFLADPEAVDRLKADEQQRCMVNNALNALKAMGAATGDAANVAAQPQQNGCLAALEALGQQICSSATPSPSPSSTAQQPSPATSCSTTNSALQLFAGLDLGHNIPIGTLLKKANSPNPSTTSTPVTATATITPTPTLVNRTI